MASFLLDHIAGARVLLVFTYRPEFVSDWSRKTYHNSMTLTRLSRRESGTMLASLLRTIQVQDELEDLVVEKSEGVPFFLEELVHSLEESDAIERRDEQWVLKIEPDSLQVPATVHDVLSARIDRLPEGAKRVLQIGAVLGREFSWDLMAALAEMPEQELRANVDALSDAELVYERGVPPDATCLFNHALTQDVAYNSLLTSRRQLLHAATGHALERLQHDWQAEHDEELAHHFTLGEVWEKAFTYLTRSGDKASQAYANQEAVAFYTEAIDVSSRITPALDEAQLLTAYKGRGLARNRLTKYDAAIADFQMMRQMARASGNQHMEGESL
jgi:predicted ATPase